MTDKLHTNADKLITYLKGKICENCRQKVKKAIKKLAIEGQDDSN